MHEEIKVIVFGPVGCGKSAILGEIEIMLKALGIPFRHENEKEAGYQKWATHADWIAELEMYKPHVVLVEDMPWLRKDEATAPIEPDWANSETLPTELWKNPLYPMNERLQMADGAVRFRDKVITNLREQLASLQAAPQAAVPMEREVLRQVWAALPQFRQVDDYMLTEGAPHDSEESYEIIHVDTIRRIVRAVFSTATGVAEWISVDDRLPEPHREVIVWREDSGAFLAKRIAYCDVEEGGSDSSELAWLADQYGWQEGSEEPTHWMPIPAAPSADKERS